MANIKSIGDSSNKWKRRAAVAGPDYEAGIKNPRRPWASSSIDAEQNYKSGVIAAANAGRYAIGIKSAGEEKWSKRALEKGPNRFAEGVALSVDDWEKGFQPYHDAISALKLPARGPKGSPQNIQRVAAVATALRAISQKKA